MFNHEPKWYICPFCLLVNWIENDKVYSRQSDIIYKDKDLMAFISSHTWPNNYWNVIIIPKKHIENIYDLPEDLGNKIFSLSKKIAIAMKEVYKCDAISVRQHNEPAWNQDVFHYHYHIIPRYHKDNLYVRHEEKFKVPVEERAKYAQKLRWALN